MYAIVIADDFSGAAELAGISLRYGLTAEILLDTMHVLPEKDVLVVCTDSRSKSLTEALETTEAALRAVKNIPSKILYKKIDSVMRGHFMEEIGLQMNLMTKPVALVIPANPSMERIIGGKDYFIKGIKVNETDFSNDPEFPVLESDIEKRFEGKVKVVRSRKEVAEGINVAEVGTVESLKQWPVVLDTGWLLAGAGDFYEALLQRDRVRINSGRAGISLPHLYVCGTTFSKTKNAICKLAQEGGPVCYVTSKHLSDETESEKLEKEVIRNINHFQKLIITIDEPGIEADAVEIRGFIASFAASVLKQTMVKELFIDGGSTAGAILDKMNIKKLDVISEFQRGVVQMQHNDLLITVKPGSFELPVSLKKLYHLIL